ncbi:MAG TPA: hypothetical protein VKB26_07235 [Candidatus Acidoferrales bacterium]|nr:hypothetical protein [Candidatus Acidoferrales bacterium]
MTRNKVCHVFALMLLLALALPAVAAPKNTNVPAGKVLARATITLYDTRSLGGATLQPGEYNVLATDSQISFLHNGKVLAQASIQWKDMERAQDNTILADSGTIKEVYFRGKKRSAVIQ